MNHEATVGVPVGSSGHPGRAVSAIGIDNRDGLGFFHPGGLRPGDRHVQRGGRKPGGNGAFAYNPAAMGFHDRTSVSLGPSSSGQASVSTRLRDTMQRRCRLGHRSPYFKLPSGYTTNGGSAWVLETRWEAGIFPKLSGEVPVTVAPGVALPLPFGAHPTNSKLEAVALVLTLVYKVSEDFSVAAGLDYYKETFARDPQSCWNLR